MKNNKIKYLTTALAIQFFAIAIAVLIALKSPKEYGIYIVMASFPVGVLVVLIATKGLRKRIKTQNHEEI